VFFRIEYSAATEILHIVKNPSKTHESPVTWLNDIFKHALLDQTSFSTSSDDWLASTSAAFAIDKPSDSSFMPRILMPDGCLANDSNRLLFVLEVAYSQTMKQVLRKVEEIWAKLPHILAVIVIKVEEIPKYRGPHADKDITEPFVAQTEWSKRAWSSKAITYDGHVWYRKIFTCFIICIKGTQEQTQEEDVCVFSIVSLVQGM
jgi:hypothetical protein